LLGATAVLPSATRTAQEDSAVHRTLVGVMLVVSLFALPGAAQTPASAGPTAETTPNDYADAKAWLCRSDLPPGAMNACDVDLSTTVVSADGKLTRETWKRNPNPPIDCFYVYPTVSTDPADHSDMHADPAEFNVVRQQFARFGSVCRTYAPLYRQVTLAGLRKMLTGGPGGVALDRGVGYDDVRDAWRYYVEHENRGRGYVLVSHSQGSYVLMEMIRQEIEGRPIQSKMVSALLLGATLPVTRGRDVGGAFTSIPLCRRAAQTGCVINYSAFRSTLPPPANTLFGKVPDASLAAACVNPAALGGGSGELHAYLDATGKTITSTPQIKPWATDAAVDTPWVSVPGLLTAKCAANENATFLEVTVHGNAAEPRVDDITGDIGSAAQPLANWGLHLIDVNLGIGNLIDIVGQQSRAYVKKK
jgi:hypothetical protein